MREAGSSVYTIFSPAMSISLISSMIWLPIASLFSLLSLPYTRQPIFRYITLGTTLLQLGMGLMLIQNVAHTPTDRFTWMHVDLGRLGTLSITYTMGVDGLNAGFILLAALVLVMGVIASWGVTRHSKAYFSLYLIIDTLIMGSFFALDFLLLYILLELTLIPIYGFIVVWGESRHTKTATKFLVYNLLGTLLILMVLIGLGLSVYDPVATGLHMGLWASGEVPSMAQLDTLRSLVQTAAVPAQAIVHSLDMTLMTDIQNFIPGSVFGLSGDQYIWGQAARLVAFMGLMIGFLIKFATVPFHGWLPDAHVEAPIPVSMLLAAILLKLGGYGLIRTAFSIFPEGALYYAWEIGIMGTLTIIYASMNALAMQDLKRMFAYASVSHMGFVLLGIASLTQVGIHGAMYQMISHGLIATLLFGVVGVLQARTQDRNLTHYRGLATQMPRYTVIAFMSFLAALGLPGFSGFVAELLVLIGVFQSTHLPRWMGILGCVGILLNASYLMWTMQRVFWGGLSLHRSSWSSRLTDLNIQEYIFFLPLLGITLILGVYPQPLLNLVNRSLHMLVTGIHETGYTNLRAILP